MIGIAAAVTPCHGDDSIAADGDRVAVAAGCGVTVHGRAGVTTISGGDAADVVRSLCGGTTRRSRVEPGRAAWGVQRSGSSMRIGVREL